MKNQLDIKKNLINVYFKKNVSINNDIVLIRRAIPKKILNLINQDLNSISELEWGKISAEDDKIKNETTRVHFVKNEKIDNLLFNVTKEMLEIYSIFYPEVKSLIESDQGYRYNFYDKQKSYYHHIDCSKLKPFYRERLISCIIQLNSDYEGGVLEFPNQNYKIKLEEGDVILFPSIHTHPHKVYPVKNGKRKNVVTWFI